MKKTSKKLRVLCTMIAVLFCLSCTTNAESSNAHFAPVSVVASDYFDCRNNNFIEAALASNTIDASAKQRYTSESKINNLSAVASFDMQSAVNMRTKGLLDYFKNCSIKLLDWKVQISELKNIQALNSDLITCDVYEWTEYKWHSNDFPFPVTSGVGIWHKLTLSGSSGYKVINDEYDESDISGIDSSNQSKSQSFYTNSDSISDSVNSNPMSLGSSAKVFSRSDAVSYANQYVGDYTSGDVQDYTFYNRQYRNFNISGGDCANFVSQCLKDAGLAETKKWYYSNSNTKCTNGTHTANNNNSYSSHICTADDTYGEAWPSSTSLRIELNKQYNSEFDTNPTPASFCLADIGFFGNGNTQTHSFICVGTGDNLFLINSHNNDRKNVPYSASTIQSQKISRLHIHSGSGKWLKYNATYHRVSCDGGCGEFILQPHYASVPGANATCLGCGYIGNISSGIMSVDEIME